MFYLIIILQLLIHTIYTKRHHYINYDKHLCPSTSLFDFQVDGYFKYPIDLFYPTYLSYLLHNNSSSSSKYELTATTNNNNGNTDDEYDIYNCSKPNFDETLLSPNSYPYHLCSVHKDLKCPITIDNIIDATRYLFNHTITNRYHNTYLDNNNNNNTTTTNNNTNMTTAND